jgi:hypothetical protein
MERQDHIQVHCRRSLAIPNPRRSMVASSTTCTPHPQNQRYRSKSKHLRLRPSNLLLSPCRLRYPHLPPPNLFVSPPQSRNLSLLLHPTPQTESAPAESTIPIDAIEPIPATVPESKPEEAAAQQLDAPSSSAPTATPSVSGVIGHTKSPSMGSASTAAPTVSTTPLRKALPHGTRPETRRLPDCCDS